MPRWTPWTWTCDWQLKATRGASSTQRVRVSNQELQDGSLEDQEIATTCKVLIQNAIVLWNALYLSQELLNTKDRDEHDEMLAAIRSGSLLTWQHVNMQGEYDFRRVAANNSVFDMGKTLALRVA